MLWTIHLLQRANSDLIATDLWPRLEPDYKIWRIMQQSVLETCISNLDELEQRLVEVWSRLKLNIVDSAVGE